MCVHQQVVVSEVEQHLLDVRVVGVQLFLVDIADRVWIDVDTFITLDVDEGGWCRDVQIQFLIIEKLDADQIVVVVSDSCD